MNVVIYKMRCPLCRGDLRGNDTVKYLCRNCNVLFEFKMKGLYIGRFQPFHKGHLEVVRKALKEVETLFIVVGGAQFSNSKKDPFTAEERKEIILESLKELGDHANKCKVVKINDIPNDEAYVSHVKQFIPFFDVVYVGTNKLNERLFAEAGYKTIKFPRFFGISATKIRKRMTEGRNWEKLLPEGAVKVIKNINGVERVKRIYSV